MKVHDNGNKLRLALRSMQAPMKEKENRWHYGTNVCKTWSNKKSYNEIINELIKVAIFKQVHDDKKGSKSIIICHMKGSVWSVV